jgi:hypothetical protein
MDCAACSALEDIEEDEDKDEDVCGDEDAAADAEETAELTILWRALYN